MTAGDYQRKLHEIIIASSNWTRVIIALNLNLLICAVMQQCMYETVIRGIDDLQNA